MQISTFFDNIFSKYQYGFRKGYSTQQCLLTMLEKWKKSVDKGEAFGALLTDLSKAFDCLNHELLIAKLNAYGFSLPALRLVHDYLSNRKQRTKINNSYSSWAEILFGVPQGSILGPLLFNIFLADLFFTLNDIDIANYADDTTPYTTADNIEDVISSLEEASKTLFSWFDDNLMKSNPDKCHLIVSSNESINLKIGDFRTANSKREKLLGVCFDSELKFDYHISEICKKASRKINALARIAPFMSINKRRTLMNAFFTSQFNYCPLIWMFHSHANNNKINRLHERCLRIIYNDKTTSFEDLLEKDSSVSIHDRNLQVLATEMFKVTKNLSPPQMHDVFQMKNEPHYNLRYNSLFNRPLVRSVYNGTESASFLGPKIWDLLPNEFKEMENLESFKRAIKKWKPEKCPCRICRRYLPNVGFI